MRKKLIVLFLSVMATTAHAQMIETEITASNGIQITQSKDEFAGRTEYGSPIVRFKSTEIEGFFLVGRVVSQNKVSPTTIQGAVVYSGEWHRYIGAIFKGGESADFSTLEQKVLSCRRGCSYSESFIIEPTKEQINKYTENGILPIQVRSASSGKTFIINIPTSHIDAINEVSSK